MKSFFLVAMALAACDAFSLSMSAEDSSRRSFMSKATSSGAALLTLSTMGSTEPAIAAPVIETLENGIKYAVTKDSKKGFTRPGYIVGIDYTGYLSNGVIFDATHSEGKSNTLLFKLGSPVVIPGINAMVAEMKVGQKVQAIIPAELAFGDKGICLEDGECLVKPGATLVYDIMLKKSSIPPP